MMTPEQAVVAAILTCIAGSVLALLTSRSKTWAGWLTFAVTGASSLLVFSAVQKVLIDAPSPQPAVFQALPQFGLALRIRVDGLSAIFLLLVALVSVLAALYAIPYMRHYRDYGVARYYPCFLLFLAGMYGLLSTTDMMWVFFLFWQLMALPSYALIRFENRKRENVRAANKYLLALELACALAMIGTRLLASPVVSHNLKYHFDALSMNLPLLLSTHSGATTLAFSLFLGGFGIVMGMWPFGQLWLPEAEAACPAPASALISGVMIKIGVYWLIRCFLFLVPANAMAAYPLAKWGWVIAMLGTITLFVGTMQALKQEQSKRLLAFHSVGQIGYILLGIGACMALLPRSGPATASLAAVAFMGALFHVLNHGLFKGLLFLNAGSMLYATDTQDLNRMGGLMKFMPLTAITALIASFSIAGVPLFNGFVSKWSIYVATIQGGSEVRYLPVCAVVAILTSALTLASFIKFFGGSFLSRTSTLVKQCAGGRERIEVPGLMQFPQIILAFFCVFLGVVPAVGFALIQRAMQSFRGGFSAALAGSAPVTTGLSIQMAPASAALFAPLVIAAVLGVMFVLAYGLSRMGRAPRRAAAPWLCGYVQEADCYRYVAHNFYGEIKRYFRWLGGVPRRHAHRPAGMRELT